MPGSSLPGETTELLMEIYHRLAAEYGPRHWWPAGGPFEVIVGAILTQSTAWTNVEKAIANLKAADALSAEALYRMPLPELARLIRPSGYYNMKARKLKAFVTEFVERYGGELERLFALDAETLRDKLLVIYGIGEETADSIVLYAANKPIFVVDTYTRRVTARLGLTPRLRPDRSRDASGLAEASYGEVQALFMDNLPPDERLFNEFHALFVSHGKHRCRKKPLCPCCLSSLCQSYATLEPSLTARAEIG